MLGDVDACIDQTSLPAEAAALIARLQQQAQAQAPELARRDREIARRDVKIDKLHFELARAEVLEVRRQDRGHDGAQRLLFAET